MLDQPCTPSVPAQQQPCYQLVKYFTYWTVSYFFQNWNIIQLSHEAISGEEIYKVNQVILHGLSYHMPSLVKTGKYGDINTIDRTTM